MDRLLEKQDGVIRVGGGGMVCFGDVDDVLNRVFGKRNQKIRGKKLREIISLLKPVVWPLPTDHDVDSVLRQIPELRIVGSRGREPEAGLINFRVLGDGAVGFDLVPYRDEIEIDRKELDCCVGMVLRLAVAGHMSANLKGAVAPNQMALS